MMLHTLLWILGGLAINMVIGAVVWSTIDDKQQHLYHWAKECPPEIKWWALPVLLTVWPIGLWLWWKQTWQ